ncbi:low molecular weight neuronal intermediate filament-like isoform X1 [Oreochromis aureus]|uniref:low molecular weight neuronal intermediate filament-like isoform X1 n=2 Tax=Oreochromis aureus TaxID=47969 RepID=UPI00195439A8|nr:low molecular weight neuronal intermediate filament-like isoform X1 [Oreochromis aureus]
MRTNRRPKDQTEDFQVSSEEDREREQLSMMWKLPITSRQQLQEEQQRREAAENTLGDLQNDKEKLEKKNTEIINQLQHEKETLEELKKQLESKNQELSDSISELNREKRIKESEINTMRVQLESNKQEMMKSEREKDEIITKLRQTILTLESKASLQEEKQRREKAEKQVQMLPTETEEEKQNKEETEKKVQTLQIKTEKISHINSPSKQKK